MERKLNPACPLTCPARTWVEGVGEYTCDPFIFTREKFHPNGGTRRRPANCPENSTNHSVEVSQRLRNLLRK